LYFAFGIFEIYSVPDAVLAASIFHYGEYAISAVKKYLDEHDVCVRWNNPPNYSPKLNGRVDFIEVGSPTSSTGSHWLLAEPPLGCVGD
jgi:hypothetical protein